jgi:threonine/homoserine/homoserine lactone efflux protein
MPTPLSDGRRCFDRSHVVSRPTVLTWMRRIFAGAFVMLGAKLALADR